MAEILSQNQIDSLLKSLTQGIEEEESQEHATGKRVKDYDFRSPKLFTREQLKLLNSIYETYARILSSHITALLQTYTHVEILEVEEQQYYEFNNALPDSVLVGMIDFSIKDGEEDDNLIIMDVSKEIAFCSIDRLLGGLGRPLEQDREFTEIELGILEHTMRGMVNLMKNPWSDYIEVSPRLTKLETNSRILQGIGADDNVVIIVMNITVNESQGKINICIPASTLDLLFKKKDAQTKRAKKGDQHTEAQRRADILNRISDSFLEIKGILGSTEVFSHELIDLEVGDIIKLDKRADSLAEVTVGDTVWFRGEVGTFNKKKAIGIKEILKRGSDPVK
ncbi:MAG: flagellar motor switch protein FliM [Anaerovoracaceae bacterium]|jgi:flagellar motor switch protein FliM